MRSVPPSRFAEIVSKRSSIVALLEGIFASAEVDEEIDELN